MKKTLHAIALLFLMSSRLAAVSAPTGLTVTPWADGGTTLTWLTDTAATQWYIYVGGIQYFSPTRTDVGRPSASTYSYNVTGISQQSLPVYITMKAVGGGQLSAFSASVTVTAVGPVPFTYVQTPPGTYLMVSGSTGSSQPVSGTSYGSITFTSVGGTSPGVVVVAAVPGKTIVVTGWSLSTDTTGRITLHHQTGAAVRSNSASNVLGGGLFGANGGERATGGAYPGLAVNQPVCVDFSTTMTAVEAVVEYYTY